MHQKNNNALYFISVYKLLQSNFGLLNQEAIKIILICSFAVGLVKFQLPRQQSFGSLVQPTALNFWA